MTDQQAPDPEVVAAIPPAPSPPPPVEVKDRFAAMAKSLDLVLLGRVAQETAEHVGAAKMDDALRSAAVDLAVCHLAHGIVGLLAMGYARAEVEGAISLTLQAAVSHFSKAAADPAPITDAPPDTERAPTGVES